MHLRLRALLVFFFTFYSKKGICIRSLFLLYLYSGGCTKRYKKREKFNSIMLNMRHETLYMEANEARWMALERLTENGSMYRRQVQRICFMIYNLQKLIKNFKLMLTYFSFPYPDTTSKIRQSDILRRQPHFSYGRVTENGYFLFWLFFTKKNYFSTEKTKLKIN